MSEKKRNTRRRILRNGKSQYNEKKYFSNTLTSMESHSLFAVRSRNKLLWHQWEERTILFHKRSSTRGNHWQNWKYVRYFCNALNKLATSSRQVNSLCRKGVAVCCGITPMC